MEWQTAFLPQIANRIRNGLDVRDRTYRLKTYKSCIVAREAVDFMVTNDIAQSREEAVRLGRLLEERLGFWHHVCDDHKFKDEFLFFRFSTIEDDAHKDDRPGRKGKGLQKTVMFPFLGSLGTGTKKGGPKATSRRLQTDATDRMDSFQSRNERFPPNV